MNELDRLQGHLAWLRLREQWHEGELTKVRDEIREVRIKMMKIGEGQRVLPGLDDSE